MPTGWLSRRYTLPRPLDPESEVLVLNGSREGLFFAAISAQRYVAPRKGKPAILMPNPFYPVYGAGAETAGCETVVYLASTGPTKSGTGCCGSPSDSEINGLPGS